MKPPAVDLLQVECVGGPQDGAVVFMQPGSVVIFPRVLFPTGAIEQNIYALEATTAGVFRLRYLSTQSER